MADEEGVEEEEVLEGVEGSDTGASPQVDRKPLDPPKYEVRPGLGEKFQAENVYEIILSSMQEQLMGRQYRADQAPRWVRTIANGIRQRTQELGMKRYKILVQTVVVEMKGAGLMMGKRCLWDPETDQYVHALFKNDSIYCHTTVYAVYMY
ncbi:dynein light chain Tctex-type protein 2B-like [Choristoneura fumiferana]|uniref:dynein light chain Tctex-type protein 2B-like n=1 Tax=Choristoneura fumiferana TaxID=7141 RepID=UPI003D158496